MWMCSLLDWENLGWLNKLITAFVTTAYVWLRSLCSVKRAKRYPGILHLLPCVGPWSLYRRGLHVFPTISLSISLWQRVCVCVYTLGAEQKSETVLMVARKAQALLRFGPEPAILSAQKHFLRFGPFIWAFTSIPPETGSPTLCFRSLSGMYIWRASSTPVYLSYTPFYLSNTPAYRSNTPVYHTCLPV